MRAPVRLALGITSAVVLGALAATVASGYASPGASAPIAAPDATVVDAPVLAPASIDGVSTLPSTENPLSMPDAIGQVRVVEPDLTDTFAAIAAGEPLPDAPLPADVLAAAAAIDAEGGDTPDTPGIVADAAAAAGTAEDATPDDPCADSAADPTTCPDGVESAIFADTHIEPLEMWIVPAARTSREGVSVWCDGAEPGPAELWLDVATNIPATIHARYWPADDPSNVHELNIPGVPSEEAAWQAEIDATGTYTPHSYVFQHCALLTVLAANTDYVVSAFAIDTHARISAPEEAYFSSAGDPTAPTMFAIPLGQSLLYVGVPYTRSQGAPTVFAERYDTGSEPPSCGTAASRSSIAWAVEPHEVEMSDTYLRNHHYISSYGLRSAGIVDVPEGTNIVVCAQWFDSSAASFDLGTPIRYESVLASAPDTATPVFTLDGIRTVQHVAQGALTITGASVLGNICGSWNGPVPAFDGNQTIAIDEVLCDRGGRLGGGSTNTFQISVSYLKPNGHRVNSAAAIRMRSSLCAGADCTLPPDATYDVGLPTVTVGAGLCGSSFGSDCTPPTRETSLGVATISVHWVPGASNGNTEWSIGSSIEAEPTAERPDSPQLDLSRGWVPALSTDGLTGSAALALRVDRPVNYTITVSGDCWKGAPPAAITGRADTAAGSYFAGGASLAGLCPGARYQSTIDMVDDAGQRTLASPVVPSTPIAPTAYQNWGGGSLTVPQDYLEISAHVEMLHGYPWSQDWWIAGADLTVGDAPWANTAHFDQTCFSASENNIPATWRTQTVPLAETLHLSLYSRFAVQGTYYGHAPASRCGWESLTSFEASAETDVTPAQLLRGILIESDFYQAIDPYHTVRGHQYVWITATRVTG